MMNLRLLSGVLLLTSLNAQAIELTDTSRVVDLDEVVVVSQPKDGRLLRRQPLSSTAFDGAELQRLNIRDLSDLSGYVPSFQMPQYGSRLTSSIYVRGTGTRINNSAVGVYYDHVPLVSKAAFNHHFYEIDRVDILRGPQGTLYGMNTEGGLVRIYSKNPMNYQGTDIHAGIGTGLTRHVELAHYHRPSDSFAFSAALFYNGQRGFFRNKNLNEWNDQSNEAGGRMRMVWKPAECWKLDLTTDYQYTNQNAFPYGRYDVLANSVDAPSTTVMNTYKRKMLTTGFTMQYEADKWLLSSVTSWQWLNDAMEMDQDYVADDFMHLTQKQLQHALTEEVAIRSRGKGWWQWTFGVSASRQWLRTEAPVNFGMAMNEQTAQRILKMMPPQIANMFTTWEIPAFYVSERFRTPTTNLGVFHESTFTIADNLDVTLGLRYDYSHVKAEYDTDGLLGLHYAMPAMPPRMPRGMDKTNVMTARLNGADSRSFRQLLPKVGITWRWDERGSNVYATASKGFRAGGYNIQMFSDIYQTLFMSNGKALSGGDVALSFDAADYERINQNISYKSEESWNFEAGTHVNNLFGGKVQADFAIYYMLIRNQQLSVMADDYNFGRIMVNAGRSTSYGLEMALRGKVLDNRLSWSATYSLTNATFREYEDSVRVNGRNQYVSYKGKRVPFVPQHAFSMTADYRIPLKQGAVKALTFGLNLTGNGKIYWNEANSYSQKFYALLGARISAEMGCATFTLWGRNLTDTRYNTFAIQSKATGVAEVFAQRGNPIQAGASIDVYF
jgi:outer membrane receptor protein involved in Fe transport